MAQVNFKLVTPAQTQERQAFEMTDRTLLQPTNANPLVMGEFVQFDSAFKLIRGDGSVPGFAVFDELGRSDVQAIGKVTVLLLGHYMADTYVFDNAAPPALGAKLMVDTVTNAAKSLTNKSGLKTHAGGDLVVGYVLRTAASAPGNYLRFLHTQA
jgi:hypothetical protein